MLTLNVLLRQLLVFANSTSRKSLNDFQYFTHQKDLRGCWHFGRVCLQEIRIYGTFETWLEFLDVLLLPLYYSSGQSVTKFVRCYTRMFIWSSISFTSSIWVTGSSNTFVKLNTQRCGILLRYDRFLTSKHVTQELTTEKNKLVKRLTIVSER